MFQMASKRVHAAAQRASLRAVAVRVAVVQVALAAQRVQVAVNAVAVRVQAHLAVTMLAARMATSLRAAVTVRRPLAYLTAILTVLRHSRRITHRAVAIQTLRTARRSATQVAVTTVVQAGAVHAAVLASQAAAIAVQVAAVPVVAAAEIADRMAVVDFSA